MALDPRYIPLYQLQQYFVDKATGEPLSGGKVYFYSDVNRNVPKMVFELSSTTGTYTYVPLPNPVILSAWGTPVDNNGNDIVIYAYPFDQFGNSELYYVVVQDADGRPQFTREAVPNSGSGSTPGNNANLFNYIPNGQFLLHTDLPSTTNELVAGTNVIAQGGFTVELPNPLNSVNTLTFEALGFTENPPNSPRFEAIFTAQTFSAMDSFKKIRIKWNDVNKFSANEDFYTFAFWAEGNVNIPIAIQIVKYFGTTGSIVPDETIFTDTITTEGQIHQYQFQFGLNEGEIVDTVNNNDFVALDISLPTDIGFQLNITDFVLVNGQQVILNFPLQTNADMVTRGNDGWTNLPQYNGDDLFLPKIQTRIGYEYYEDDVGDIGTTIRNIVSPLSVSPLPTSNRMLLDGSSYLFNGYSTIGIPFARLGEVLIAESPLANTPMYGTGANFATIYTNEGNTNIFRLTVNSNGVGINPAIEGGVATGFNFHLIPTYNGSTTGSNSLNYFAFTSGVLGNQFICKGNFKANTPVPGDLDYDNYGFAGTSGFTVTNNPTFSYRDGLYAQQTVAFSVNTVAAAALIQGPLVNALQFYFWTDTNRTTGYYIWFNVTGEVDPGPPAGGLLPIEVRLNSTDTNVDVCHKLAEVVKALQITDIEVTGNPPASSYFTFQANPAAIANYHVWYSNQNGGTEPIIPGSIGINVLINTADSNATVATKTLIAINKYQYAVPNAQGMFFRNSDPTGLWDFDNLTRFSNVTGLNGPNVGTFEYSQLLNHVHWTNPNGDEFVQLHSGAGSSFATPGGFAFNNPVTTGDTGGSETRPVNMYVNYYIKY